MKNVLIIGGHGHVALHATPKLIDKGHKVTSLFRNPDHETEVTDLGATPLVRDVTELSVSDWTELFQNFDTVVWSAGAGGKGDTLAIDRDAALRTIEALESLDDAPDYVMVSYIGARTNTADKSEGSWYDYVEAKKAVDNRLFDSQLNFLVLGPATLTHEPAGGIEIIGENEPTGELVTSRELVADVITEVVDRQFLPTKRNPLEFIDGDSAVSSI